MRSNTLVLLLTVASALGCTVVARGQFPSRRGQPANANPPRVIWQRTLRDALYLARIKKLPLLVVANQDGEPASDTLANGRYRSAEFAQLTSRFVAVVGSPDRHNPNDYDDQGRRILCPRFGCITCGEHRAIEPELFAAYFKNRRVAPRHIGIGVDGKELFERILENDLRRIDQSLREHGDQKSPPPQLTTADRSLPALLKSRANADRAAVEAQFDKADPMQRVAILVSAAASGNDHPALVRRGMMAGNPEVLRAAAMLLNATVTTDSVNVVLQFLGRAPTDALYAAVLPALAKIATDNDTARRALAIRKALRGPFTLIDPAAWRARFQEAAPPSTPELVPNETLAELDGQIEAQTKAAKAATDGKAWLEVAHATLRYALNRIQNRKDPTFLLMDAEQALSAAVKQGLPAAQAASLRTRILWLQNKKIAAGGQALLAVSGSPPALANYAGTHTAPQVLEILARTQTDVLYKPIEKESDYPVAAVTNVHAAYEALAAHPAATAAQAKAHLDILLFLGARFEAGKVLERAVARYPSDPSMHQYLRDHAYWKNGNRGLETAYAAAQTRGENATTDWYAGYAGLLAAEGYVRAKADTDARRAYGQAIASMSRSARTESFRDSAQHYVALAHGGLAKLELDAGQFAAARRHVEAGMSARPASFGSVDGLGNSLQRTTRRLRRKLPDAETAGLDAKMKELNLSLDQKG